MQEKEPQYINSIIRATAILELYEKLNVQYLGIAEISKELGIQKTTVFNIVKTLVHQGWLIQDNPNGKYRLGTRILRVSTMITRSITTEELIEKEMRRLRDEYNEDVVLTAMVDGVPICVEKVKSANYRSHASLDKFRTKFASKIENAYILYTKDVMEKDGILHLPVYMAMFL